MITKVLGTLNGDTSENGNGESALSFRTTESQGSSNYYHRVQGIEDAVELVFQYKSRTIRSSS